MGKVEPPEDEVIGGFHHGEQGKRQVLLSAPVLGSADAFPHVVPVGVHALPHLHPLHEVGQVDDVVELEVGGVGRITSDPRPKDPGVDLAQPLSELLPPRPLLHRPLLPPPPLQLLLLLQEVLHNRLCFDHSLLDQLCGVVCVDFKVISSNLLADAGFRTQNIATIGQGDKKSR